jgi:hypothetical protein
MTRRRRPLLPEPARLSSFVDVADPRALHRALHRVQLDEGDTFDLAGTTYRVDDVEPVEGWPGATRYTVVVT